MESINFAGAMWRSWRLLVLLAIVGAVIAVLWPLTPVKQPKPVLHFKAQAVVGAAPKGGSNLIGGSVTAGQIVFYANSLAVQQRTIRNAHQNIPFREAGHYLNATAGVPKSSGTTASTTKSGKVGKNSATSNVATLTAFGKTKANAIRLANVYALTLVQVVDADAAARQRALAQQKAAGKPTAPPQSGTTSPTTATTGSTGAGTGLQIQSGAGTATHVAAVKGGPLDSRKTRLAGGFLLGLALGVVIVIIREMLDKRIRTAARAVNSFGYPVIVEIPAHPPSRAEEKAAPVNVALQPGTVQAEAFRMLRMSVVFEALGGAATVATDPLGLALAGNGHGTFGTSVPVVPELSRREPGERRVVLVVSPTAEETRPKVAANLASVYAEAGQRVIVASTAELGVGRPITGGNGALLTGDIHPVDVEARLVPTRVENVFGLPFSMFLQNSGQLVSRGKELLEAARTVSDAIIVETPGLLVVHHAEALSHAVDVVVVVAECRVTRIAEARRASDLLRRIGAPVLGVVLTNVPVTRRQMATEGVGPIGPVGVPEVALPRPAPGTEVVNTVGSDEPTAKTQI